jgi:TfoX/Sxy family transcriptional regulator of competence genes
MAYSEELAGRLRKLLARKKGFEEKKMFAGIGFLLNGNLCVGVRDDCLIVRFDPDETDATLQEPHVREFQVGPRSMKGWAYVGPGGVEDDSQLKSWVERSTSYVKTLPAK